ncbi:MAG: tRNA (adenosine(37)-N6)-dimethylallyltransferase MiaA [Bacteroidales bacterium]|nr:tRNA (adenosine(37)-N6)-dimethylallyltransferase MiaA [Bacteroidales bacterium]
MTDALPSLIVITGPTAVGKTRLAIELAKILSSEIISCDSRQFYKEMNIGVARPSPKELNEVPHHMISFLSVADPYNAFRFEKEVLRLTEKLFRSNSKAIMVGGSGLYIHAVTHGIDELPDPDPELRLKLKERLLREGIEALQTELKRLDPHYFGTVDRENPKRLLRALEVCLTTGLPYSSLRKGQAAPRPFRTVRIGLNTDRMKLYERINHRVDSMMQNGLLDEVRSLESYKELNALNTVGYKELFSFLEGKCSLEEAVEKIKTNTRRYAKRQLTWLKKDPEIRWFEPDELEAILKYIEGDVMKHLASSI